MNLTLDWKLYIAIFCKIKSYVEEIETFFQRLWILKWQVRSQLWHVLSNDMCMKLKCILSTVYYEASWTTQVSLNLKLYWQRCSIRSIHMKVSDNPGKILNLPTSLKVKINLTSKFQTNHQFESYKISINLCKWRNKI